jgi:hypothetical protein
VTADEFNNYKFLRASKHPWMDAKEAAFELDVTQQRIGQLVAAGAIGSRNDPRQPGKLQLRSADVYGYNANNRRKPTS